MPTRLGMKAMRNRDSVGVASVDFLYYSGYIVLGWYLLRIGAAAQKHITAGNDADGYYKSKVDLCDFYFHRVFPRAKLHRELALAPTSSVMQMKNETICQF